MQKITGINDPDLLDLLQRCFEWDQTKRITATEALKHKFFETTTKKSHNSEKSRESSIENKKSSEVSNTNKIKNSNELNHNRNYSPTNNSNLIKKVHNSSVNSKKYVSPSNYSFQSSKNKKSTLNARGKSPASLGMNVASTSAKKRQKSLSDSTERVYDGRIGYTYSNLNSSLYKSKNKSKSPRLGAENNIINKNTDSIHSIGSSPSQTRTKKTTSQRKPTKNKVSSARTDPKNHSSLITTVNHSMTHTKNNSQIPKKKSPRRKSPSCMIPSGY